MKKNLSMFLFLVLVNSMFIMTLEESKSKLGLGLSVDTVNKEVNQVKPNLKKSTQETTSTGTTSTTSTTGTTGTAEPKDKKSQTEPTTSSSSTPASTPAQPTPAPAPAATSTTSTSNSTSTSTTTTPKRSLLKRTSDPADKIDEQIDGIGSSTKNPSNGAKASTTPLIISASPFKVKECNQMLMFDAEYIEDLRDYRKRKPAFFTINVFSVHMFKSKDANALIHSVNFPSLKQEVLPLKGARGCLSIDGGAVTADVTICFKSETDSANLLNAINAFAKCRQGENLVEVSEETLKALQKSCEGEKKVDPNELNLEVRQGNKWDADRARHFQPNAIAVPGTNPPEAAKK